MKKLLKIIFTFLFFSSAAMAIVNPGPDGVRFNKIEIYNVEKNLAQKLSDKSLLSPEEAAEIVNLQTLLNTGKRAITWFEKVNAGRPADNKLDLTVKGAVKGAVKGMPMTEPMKTNTNILVARYNKLLRELNPLIINVVTGSTELPSDPLVNDEEFVKAIHALDVLYQHTIRWSNAKESLTWFIHRSLWDIRGYTFLKETTDLENKLTHFSANTPADQENLKNWSVSLCHNGNFDDSQCDDEMTQAIQNNNLLNYYQKYVKFAEAQYNSFFEIPDTRPEIYWNQDKTKLYSPFLTPTRLDVKNWLAENIQDEWKGVGFNLLLDFKTTSSKTIPHIVFQSGVTAHVDAIAGDTITMDGDYSISSYDQRWSIRHEYGHVLGFVDCYLEFYDVNERAMIYYEVDIDNLMCSRHGNLLPLHIAELRSAYK